MLFPEEVPENRLNAVFELLIRKPEILLFPVSMLKTGLPEQPSLRVTLAPGNGLKVTPNGLPPEQALLLAHSFNVKQLTSVYVAPWIETTSWPF
jgi:hypothetical protein